MGFDGKKVLDKIGPGEGRYPQAVCYKNDFPRIAPLDSNEKWELIFKVKALCWEYEKEIRVIGKPDSTLELAEGTMTQVILGINCSRLDKERVIAILRTKSNRPFLFQAFPKRKEFAIDLQELKY